VFQLSKDELGKLVQGFEKQDILTSSGVTLAGNRYIYLSGTDKVIRAKLGKVGVHCMKTQQGECEAALFIEFEVFVRML
jgi:Profilin.